MLMRIRLVVTLCAALVAGAAAAHHSLSGQFDTSKHFEIDGVVTRVNWTNPHVYVFVDVKDANGAVQTYRIETLPVAMMRKAGLTQQKLLGDGRAVNITAHPARNGDPLLGYMLVLKMADGQEVQFNAVPGAEKTE
ncbi:MAG: hypothetical protein LBE59_06990 [Nevskiaceae bacterium]|jgi:hypothetical protein|nr:hypothetical protein [Nevskiaceae bacterium]